MGKRNKVTKEMQSMPDDFDIVTAGESVSGNYSGIQVFGAAFANNATDMEVAGTGKNMSALNAVFPDGGTIMGAFTKITVPAAATDMVVIAYKG